MKNFKKIALGLMVGAMAIGFSAFTSVKPNVANTHRKSIPAGFLVQVSNGVYEYRSSLDGDCVTPVTDPCHYDVTTPNNIPSTQTQWTKAQVATYSGVSNASTDKRLFIDN